MMRGKYLPRTNNTSFFTTALKSLELQLSLTILCFSNGYLVIVWLNYDRRFHLRVAVQPRRSWAAIDSTIWNLAFAGQAKATQCSHCFSFAHCTSRCHLNEEQPVKKPMFLSGRPSDSIQPTDSEVVQFVSSGTKASSPTVPNSTAASSMYVTYVRPTRKQTVWTTRPCSVQLNIKPVCCSLGTVRVTRFIVITLIYVY